MMVQLEREGYRSPPRLQRAYGVQRQPIAARSRMSPEAEMEAAAQLDVDVETYRMLRELEQRDIVPEDYELLGHLDKQVKAATLSLDELEQFPIQVYPAGRAG